jgi:hypothetical protein
VKGPDSLALLVHGLTQPFTCSSRVSQAANVSAPLTLPVNDTLPIRPGVAPVASDDGGAIWPVIAVRYASAGMTLETSSRMPDQDTSLA